MMLLLDPLSRGTQNFEDTIYGFTSWQHTLLNFFPVTFDICCDFTETLPFGKNDYSHHSIKV